MSKNIEAIAFRKCLNPRCRNFGGKWPAEFEACPVCDTSGWLMGVVVKDHSAEESEPVEEPGD